MSISPQQRVIDVNLVNALKLFVSKDESRLALSGIHFTRAANGKPIAVATDGRKLAVVEQYTVDAGELPAFPNGGYPQDTVEDITVPVKPLIDALRKVPKKATTLPVLLTPPLISIRMGKDEPAQVCIPVTDLDTHSIETTNAIAASFPNYQQVIPPENATMLEIMFDAELLLDIAKAAEDFAKNGKDKVSVKLCVGDNPGAPLRVEVIDGNKRKMTMIAMPLKEPGLVNKVGNAVLANCVNEITQRLETATAGIEALLQPKKHKAKEPSADVQQPQAVTQAA